MDWLEILEKIFEIAVFPIITAAAAYLITWIRAKNQELKKKAKDDTTKKYLDLLEQTIIECVFATNQTYVSTLKKEGIFNAEAQKTAFNMTFEAVKSVLTADAEMYLTEAVKDLDVFITNKIEAHVGMSK